MSIWEIIMLFFESSRNVKSTTTGRIAVV